MNFIEAVKAMQDGKRVTNSELKYYSQYLSLNEEGEPIVEGDESDVWEFDLSNYTDETWEIYQEEPKLHTFEEALAALKDGKTIRRKSIYNSTIVLVNSRFIETINGKAFPVYFYESSDLLANDWIIKEDLK